MSLRYLNEVSIHKKCFRLERAEAESFWDKWSEEVTFEPQGGYLVASEATEVAIKGVKNSSQLKKEWQDLQHELVVTNTASNQDKEKIAELQKSIKEKGVEYATAYGLERGMTEINMVGVGNVFSKSFSY